MPSYDLWLFLKGGFFQSWGVCGGEVWMCARVHALFGSQGVMNA